MVERLYNKISGLCSTSAWGSCLPSIYKEGTEAHTNIQTDKNGGDKSEYKQTDRDSSTYEQT